MDLLSDIGAADQLTGARLENAVLQERVKKLTDRVKLLAVENETLKAEVEIYREQAAVPTFSKLALGNSAYTDDGMDVDNANSESDAFVRAGNGIYPNQNQVTLEKLHEMANPLCCALSPDDTVLATGGADATVRLSQWGAAFDTNTTPVAVAQVACRLQCAAPVICVAFSPLLRGVAAAGCMDGSLHILNYKTVTGAGIQASGETLDDSMKHRKFVRGVAWSDRKPILATAGADGTVQVFRAERTGMDFEQVTLSKLESFHLQGAVESLCFVQDKLVCYARGFPHLSLFDMNDNFKQTKINLNGGVGTAGFTEHVSFAVMHLKPWHDKFLAAATDNSRNIIIDVTAGKIVRNLYGHVNDGYSQPKVAWSTSGHYLYGNTQEDGSICVWDIASSTIVERLKGHTSPVRDIFSSPTSDTVVSSAFDKATRFWFAPTIMS